MNEKKLTLFEAMCIITGYGIGSGVLLLPYYIAKVGFFWSLAIVAVAFVVSVLLHLMIADLSLKAGEGNQILSIFNKYLFKGRFKNLFTWLFFGLMIVTLVCNLAIYISGSSALINSLFPVGELIGQLIFYVIAAGFVFFGLKVIGICEKYAIIVIILLVGILSVATIFVPHFPLPIGNVGTLFTLSLFGKVMFVFVAFFSVPQVVNGLQGDKKKIKWAVIGGLLLNLVISLAIVICSLAVFQIPQEMASSEYLAIVAWVNALGDWAKYLGTGMTLLAFLTTFWSISLALSDIVKEQLKTKKLVCWLVATIPSLLLTLILPATFESYINLAGGVIAILIVILLLPAFKSMVKTEGRGELLGKASGNLTIVFVGIGYILMAIGSMI